MKALVDLAAMVDDIRCDRCGKRLRHPVHLFGMTFGPKCAKKVTPIYRVQSYPVVNGVATLPDGTTIRLEGGVAELRVPVVGWQ